MSRTWGYLNYISTLQCNPPLYVIKMIQHSWHRQRRPRAITRGGGAPLPPLSHWALWSLVSDILAFLYDDRQVQGWTIGSA
jgi:hypothetical protein